MKSAVIDVGSARTKLTIAQKSEDKDYHFSAYVFDTEISHLLNRFQVNEACQVVIDILQHISSMLAGKYIDKILYSSTHVFQQDTLLLDAVLFIEAFSSK